MLRPGYVYILTNETMAGLVKIGRTSREVDVRAAELWQTGVPSPFEVFRAFKTPDCVQLEAYAHGDLRKHRVSKSREFFRVEPWDAADRIRFWLEVQGNELVGDMFGGAIGAAPIMEICAVHAVRPIAEQTGESLDVVSHAISILTADELRPAIARARVQLEAEHQETLKRIGVPESKRWSYFDDE